MAAQPEGATPGPWRVSEIGRFIEAADGAVTVAEVRGYDGRRDDGGIDDDANARLISAAPDLYAALKVFLEARATGSANHLKLAETAARSAMLKADGNGP